MVVWRKFPDSSSREIFLIRRGNKEQSCLEFVEPKKQKGVARWLRRISPAGQGRGMAQVDAGPEEENHFMIREADLPAKVRPSPEKPESSHSKEGVAKINIYNDDEDLIYSRKREVENMHEYEFKIPYSKMNISDEQSYGGSAIINVRYDDGNELEEILDYARIRKLTEKEKNEINSISSTSSSDEPDYQIVSENDTSINNCKRMQYKIIVDDNAIKDELEDILKDVYYEKKENSDKTMIFAYKEFQKSNIDNAL